MIEDLNQKIVEKKNLNFFDKNINYQNNIKKIDTYKKIYSEISKKLKGTKRLLDIGHGGVFDYNTKLIKEITGLDLTYMNYKNLPKNVKLVTGSVLNFPNNFPMLP